MKCNTDINMASSRDLAPAIDPDEVELALDLIERALVHFDFIVSTALAEIDDDTLDTYRRILMREALMRGLVAINTDRDRVQEERDLYLCVGGVR